MFCCIFFVMELGFFKGGGVTSQPSCACVCVCVLGAVWRGRGYTPDTCWIVE